MQIARKLTLVAVLALAAFAAPAGAATTTTYPSALDARTFAGSQGGWTSDVAYGGTCIVPGVTCPVGRAEFVASGGAAGIGDGHLRASVTTFVSVLSDVTVTWVSPTFTAPAQTDEATFAFSVRPQLAPLLRLGATVTVDAVLTDLDVPADSTTLASVPFPAASASFAEQELTVPDGAIEPGRRYRVELRTLVDAPAAVATSGTIDFDDVSLQLVDLLPPTGLTAAVPGTGALRVDGQVDPHGQATDVTVEYGATAAYGAVSVPASVNGSGTQGFTVPLTGLTAGARYHYRVVATNADGSLATGDGTFVVPQPPPGTPPPGTPPGDDDDPAAPAPPPGAGAASAAPALAGGPALTDPGRYGETLRQCFGAADVVVLDARRSGRRVLVHGLTRYAPGTAVAIVDERGRTLGQASANARGRFAALVAQPPASRRAGVRYRALVGASRSVPLGLRRSNAIRSLRMNRGVVTIRGRVDVGALGRRVRIAARGARGAGACRRTSALRRVGKVRLDRRTGAYVLRVRVPGGSGMLAVRTRAVGAKGAGASAFALR